MTPFGAIAKSRVKNSKPKLFEQSFLPTVAKGWELHHLYLFDRSSFKMNLWIENHAECEHNIIIV